MIRILHSNELSIHISKNNKPRSLFSIKKYIKLLPYAKELKEADATNNPTEEVIKPKLKEN